MAVFARGFASLHLPLHHKRPLIMMTNRGVQTAVGHKLPDGEEEVVILLGVENPKKHGNLSYYR